MPDGRQTPKPSKREREEVRMGYRMMGIGFESVSQVGAGLLIGWLIDHLRAGAVVSPVTALWPVALVGLPLLLGALRRPRPVLST